MRTRPRCGVLRIRELRGNTRDSVVERQHAIERGKLCHELRPAGVALAGRGACDPDNVPRAHGKENGSTIFRPLNS